MKIGFLLLCHGDPDQIMRLLRMSYFSSADSKVYIHYDGNANQKNINQLNRFCQSRQDFQLLQDTVSCAWGEYSLVEATHRMMDACLTDSKFTADYLFLISGSCIPIKAFDALQQYLKLHSGTEFIQAVNTRYQNWVKDGLQNERYEYTYPYNFISERKKFEAHLEKQQITGTRRNIPEQLKQIHFGSQWFCISNKTGKKISRDLKNPELKSFFEQSWIPDEFAIQSLVALHVPRELIANANLTHYQFRNDGKPVVFYNDHLVYLKMQPHFFARKVSKYAYDLYHDEDRLHDKQIDNTPEIKKLGTSNKSLEIHTILHQSPNNGGKIGRIEDEWCGGIEKNHKPYWVLVGHSRAYIKEVILRLRKAEPNKPYFGYLFAQDGINNFTDKEYFGVRPSDRIYRDYQAVSYLYQIIHSHEDEVVLCFDYDDSEHVREVVRWDKNARIVILEPETKSDLEKVLNRLDEREAKELKTLKSEEVRAVVEQKLDKQLLNYWYTNSPNNKSLSMMKDQLNDTKLGHKIDRVSLQIKTICFNSSITQELKI